MMKSKVTSDHKEQQTSNQTRLFRHTWANEKITHWKYHKYGLVHVFGETTGWYTPLKKSMILFRKLKNKMYILGDFVKDS